MSATISAPPRSIVQREEALERANRTRSFRAQLKRDVHDNRDLLLPVLLEPPALTHTMKVLELLLAVPRVGSVKANNVLRWCGVSPSKTLGGLSERQRRELAGWAAKAAGRS